jgi:hypothetical protein
VFFACPEEAYLLFSFETIFFRKKKTCRLRTAFKLWQAAESSPPSSWSSGSLLQWPQSATSSSTASSKGSSRMSSQVSSPPTTPVEAKRSDAWDLLHAAAGEVVRLKMHQQHQQKKSIMSSSSSPTHRYHPKQLHHVQCQQQQPPQAQCFQVRPAAAAPQIRMLPGCRIVATNAPPPTTGILQAATILPHLRNTNERRAPIHGSSAYHQQGWNSAVARGKGHQHYSTHVSFFFVASFNTIASM